MRRPFLAAPGPLVFAHRGGADLAPENTIVAFEMALGFGVDGLELDVRLSRNGTVVVHHDRLLDRTTNLRGEVSDFTADELARADAGYFFSTSGERPFRGRGIGVPTLASVLERCRDTRVIVEMKVNSAEMARATVEVVRRSDAVDRVCLGSFARGVLREARATERAIATSAAREEVRWALYRSWFRWPAFGVQYDVYQVPEISKGGRRVVSPRFVEAAHRAGLPVQVWTIDSESDAERLLQWRVDALITNRPDVMVPVVRRLTGLHPIVSP